MSNVNEILNNLSEDEKKFALEILSELSSSGTSEKYNKLLYADYEEIPVNVETFLHDSKYLGKGLTNEEGKFTLYPYWEEVLKKIYPDPLLPAKYNTLALTGGIGLGKSTVAVIIGIYELYRMLCLKDPYLHYGLMPTDLITFAVMNITMDAAKGVAWDKIQSLIQSSSWFMSHGSVTRSDTPEWKPPKGIELIYGSLSRHIIGRAVYWCLDGDTEILTSEGNKKLIELVDKPVQVYNISENGDVVLSEVCTVKPTAVEIEEYEIELEDGSVIKCTPTHRFMLTNGSYKEAQFLTAEDEILEFIPVGYVYKVTNKINGNFYIGKRQKSCVDEKYWGSGKIQQRELKKYGTENFEREILCWARTLDELRALEEKYIKESFDNAQCLNIKRTSEGGDTTSNTKKITDGINEKHIPVEEDVPEGWQLGSKNKGIPKSEETRLKMKESWTAERRKEWSMRTSGNGNSQWGNSDAHKGERNGRYGVHLSDETKEKISRANTGKTFSKEVNKSKGRPGRKKPDGFGEKIRQANLGTHWYNNGLQQRKYHDDEVPEGWERGMLK